MTALAPAVPEPDPIPGSNFGLAERAGLAMALVDPSRFDTATLVAFLVQADAERSRWDAARVRFEAELAARDPSEDRWSAEEVGSALRLSPKRAMTEVKNAARLHDELPATFTRLARGEITARQATLVVEASYRLPDDAAVARLDEAAAGRCGELSEPQTRQFLAREVLRADPAGSERRHRRAVTDRTVRLTAAEDGMAWLSAFLPAPEAVACMQRLDTAARRHRQAHRTATGAPADPRTLDQLRADLFTDALLTAGSTTVGGAHARSAAGSSTAGTDGGDVVGGDVVDGPGPGFGLGGSVNVIVSAATLLGQDDEPGWLDRYGPISADTARRVAEDPTGTWRRLVTDPTTGQLTDVGTRRYRPPAAIRRHVELRDGTCRFPYCTHPATGCDLDHAIPYPEGPTSVDNLHAVSRRHHRAKTEKRWRVTFDPDTGETTWTSPTGRKRTTRPPQRWTVPGDTPVRSPAANDGSPCCEPEQRQCVSGDPDPGADPELAADPGPDADPPPF